MADICIDQLAVGLEANAWFELVSSEGGTAEGGDRADSAFFCVFLRLFVCFCVVLMCFVFF